MQGNCLLRSTPSFEAGEDDWDQLVSWYDGNPLALELAAKLILDVYEGNVTTFVIERSPMFKSIADLLDQHFERLSDAEREVAYWLAINREPTSLKFVRDDLLTSESRKFAPSTIQQLRRRLSIVETGGKGFALQSMVTEYLTERLVTEVSNGLKVLDCPPEALALLHRHALFKALSKEYIRDSQSRLLLQPICERLLAALNSRNVLHERFVAILKRIEPELRAGYLPGNLLNLLCQGEGAVGGWNFSGQTIRQGYFQGADFHSAKFRSATFDKCVFSQTFGESSRWRLMRPANW